MAPDLSKIPTNALLEEIERRGNKELKENASFKEEKRLLFVGPPGSGKGTQAQRIKDQYCLCHLSTGDMLRQAAKRMSKQHQDNLQRHLDKGELVPDNIVIELVRRNIGKRECAHGFILDGFPRTRDQANKLALMLNARDKHVTHVLSFELDEESAIERNVDRLVHIDSGRVYNTKTAKPAKEGLDDVTGAPLQKRTDDTEEIIRKKYHGFQVTTAPILELYAKAKVLRKIDAKGTQEEVQKRVEQVIGKPILRENNPHGVSNCESAAAFKNLMFSNSFLF